MDITEGTGRYGSWDVDPGVYDHEGTINWKPRSLVDHDKSFVKWIDSITKGFFPNKIFYLPYELYKLQALKWLNTEADPQKLTDDSERDACIQKELGRIDHNTLYFACKYGKVSEGSDESGMIRFRAKEHNAFVFYLLDCGYCILLDKPRQIFLTTTMGIFASKRLVTRFNYYMKFITCTDSKGEEIIRDKFKFPFSQLPFWSKPIASTDSINSIACGEKKGKGQIGFPNTRIEQVAPSTTAINGGAPQISFIDEIGEVPELIDTLLEIRPTLFIDKNQDGNLHLVRQIIGWGTGVTNNRGKQALERLFMSTLSLWDAGQYRAAMFVPVFLSWHCRCDQKTYDQEKQAYVTGAASQELSGMSEKQREEVFYMHYPSTFRDSWGTSSNMLVDREIPLKARERIRNLTYENKPVAGWFDPIYDINVPMPETSDVPYKIIGAKWVPADDKSDPSKISTLMMLKPNRAWRNRYYQGTDPIANETGVSFMSSVIWDRNVETEGGTTEAPACLIYHRKPYAPKETYLQCLLMGLYYDTNHSEGAKEGCPELIENNIGGSYKEYLESKGFLKRVVYNTELFDADLRGGGANWGINTSGRGQNRRKVRVVSRLRELINLFHNNIYFDIFWKELETYVNVQKADESWAPVDKKLYRDDCLDATGFSYICSLCFIHKPTYKVDEKEAEIRQTEYPLVRLPNGTLSRLPKTKMLEHAKAV